MDRLVITHKQGVCDGFPPLHHRESIIFGLNEK
jgi:hypothetical protein